MTKPGFRWRAGPEPPRRRHQTSAYLSIISMERGRGGDGRRGAAAEVVTAGRRRVPVPRQSGDPVTLHALRVGAGERESGKELGRHAAPAAAVKVPATRACSRRLRLAELKEQRRVLPDVVEAAVRQDIPGAESGVDRERAGVDVAH